MNNSLKSDKSLSQYLLKAVQPGILRRINLNIRRQYVKNGYECSSIAVRRKHSPLYLHTLGYGPAVQESFLYATRSQYCSVDVTSYKLKNIFISIFTLSSVLLDKFVSFLRFYKVLPFVLSKSVVCSFYELAQCECYQ